MKKISRYTILRTHPLDEEIEGLNERKTQLENTLSQNWDYLREDHTQIIIRSIFRKAGFHKKSSILKMIINLSRFQETIGKFTLKGFSWLGNILEKWFDKSAQ